MEQSEIINKKENIIVWLDFDAYSYVNFGAIIELAKLDKFDFIGIVTTKQDMSFFEHQKIIPFKKLVYYPDCYIKKSDFDLLKLKEIETKYELNLWLDVFTERSFYLYWTEFYKFSKEEIFNIIEKSILFFIQILEEFQPKMILTQYIGENISNLLLYKIGKKMNIKTIMPVPMFIHNRIILSDNIVGNEIIDEYKKIIGNFEDTSNKFTEKYIQKENFSQTLKIQSTYNSNILTSSQKINHYKKRIFTNLEPIYKNKGKSQIKLIKNKFQQYFEIRKREKFLNSNSIKKIEDDNYILFPMQSMPEAKVLTISPFYSNQISLIENIAKSIPINTILYVKEHPIQKTKLWRSVEFYKKIIAIPNVKLVHPSVNSQKLIANTKAVVLISGGTGFEAIFHKKPVILFSEEIYEELSTVTKVSKFDNLHKEISEAITNFKFNIKEINALMTVIENQSISIPYFTMIKEGVTLSAIQRNKKNPEITLQYFKKFYETYEKSFKEYAKGIYSKF